MHGLRRTGVVAHRQYEGGGDAGKTGSEQRRSPPVTPCGFAVYVVADEPPHRCSSEGKAGRNASVRVHGRGQVEHGIEQHLEDDRRDLPLARHQGQHGGEVAASAVAGDTDAAGDEPLGFGLRVDPAQGSGGIVEGRRIRVLWRQPVVHGDNADPRAARDVAAQPVMRVQSADH